MQIQNISFNSLTATLFHSSFIRQNRIYFTAKIFNIHVISMRLTDIYVNVCRGIFTTWLNIYGGTSLRKSQKSFIVNVQLGSKYTSGISFIVEKV